MCQGEKVKKGLQQKVFEVQKHRGIRKFTVSNKECSGDGKTEPNQREDTSPQSHTANSCQS